MIEIFFNFWVDKYIGLLEDRLERKERKYSKNIFQDKKILVEEILDFLDEDYYATERSAIKLVLLIKMENFVDRIIEELNKRKKNQRKQTR